MLAVFGYDASDQKGCDNWVVQHVAWEEPKNVAVEIISAYAPYRMKARFTNEPGDKNHRNIR